MTGLRDRWVTRRRGWRPEARTIALIAILLGFESVLYSVVAPLLPHYQHEFAASKSAIGLLAAAYPAGMLVGSLLGGWVATRFGVRRATVLGLVLFAAAIVPFGFASDLAALDALRFVQGIGCGLIWGGGLAWVIAIAPRGRRNEMLGSVFAAAVFGTLVGPILGTVAVTAGTEVVFACVGLVAVGLTVWTLQFPEPPRASLGGGAPARVLVRSPQVRLGFWLILLEACTVGALGTLLPLRLSRFGAGGVAIGLTLVAGSLLSTVLTPAIGRVIDRRGIVLPLSVGLGLSALLVALLPLPQSALLLAGLTVVAWGGPLIASAIPAMSLMTDAVERVGAALAFGSMLLNVAWSLGEMLGAPAAASLSHATSDAVPLLLLAAAMALTLGLVLRERSRATASGAVSSTLAPRSSDPAADHRASRRVSPPRSHPDRAVPAAPEQGAPR
jgi:UMF2 family putative MFS family transporter